MLALVPVYGHKPQGFLVRSRIELNGFIQLLEIGIFKIGLPSRNCIKCSGSCVYLVSALEAVFRT